MPISLYAAGVDNSSDQSKKPSNTLKFDLTQNLTEYGIFVILL